MLSIKEENIKLENEIKKIRKAIKDNVVIWIRFLGRSYDEMGKEIIRETW